MAGRVTAILDRLEAGEATASAVESPPLSYLDRTRWRRKPPSNLTDGRPKTLGDRIRHR